MEHCPEPGGTPPGSPVKGVNLSAAFSPNRRVQASKWGLRRARDGLTPLSIKRASKTARKRVALPDKDEMHAYVKDALAKMEAQMLEKMVAFKADLRAELHTFEISVCAKWKEELQENDSKLRKENTTLFQAELGSLEEKMLASVAKDMLKLVNEGLNAESKAMRATKDKEIADLKVQVETCKREVSIVVEKEIQKSKDAIAAVEANVSKEVHTWAEIAKDAKQKVEEVNKEVKECAPWIEVVKKNRGMPTNKTEVMNATLEEEAKRKVKALRIRVVGLEEKKTAKEDAVVLCGKMGAEETLVLDAWRVGDMADKRHRILILKFEDIGKKIAFLAKRSALKGEKIYLDEDLTPAQVAHRKECMPKVLEARKQGKFAVYRDGRVIIAERKAR